MYFIFFGVFVMKFVVSLLFLMLLISCDSQKEEKVAEALSQVEEQTLFDRAKQIFGALPDKMPGSENDTEALIELGKKLYFETKLSVNNTQSCNTCHNITNGMAGDDNKPVSPGAIEGKIGRRNSPTVLNAGYQFVQFWDGRSPDLVDQAKGPIINPDEMAMPNEKTVEKTISAIPEYIEMFKNAFPNEKKPITYHNIAVAIAAFERTLISKSRFDDYIGGKRDALTIHEKKGMKAFIDNNCIMCHTGPLLGGSLYQKMGLLHPYENTDDLGRYEVTKIESDKYMFKVAMLRNVALTHPYFHDGKVDKLEDAVKKMAWLNLGKELSDSDVNYIIAFLNSLTDKSLENQRHALINNHK